MTRRKGTPIAIDDPQRRDWIAIPIDDRRLDGWWHLSERPGPITVRAPAGSSVTVVSAREFDHGTEFNSEKLLDVRVEVTFPDGTHYEYGSLILEKSRNTDVRSLRGLENYIYQVAQTAELQQALKYLSANVEEKSLRTSDGPILFGGIEIHIGSVLQFINKIPEFVESWPHDRKYLYMALFDEIDAAYRLGRLVREAELRTRLEPTISAKKRSEAGANRGRANRGEWHGILKAFCAEYMKNCPTHGNPTVAAAFLKAHPEINRTQGQVERIIGKKIRPGGGATALKADQS